MNTHTAIETDATTWAKYQRMRVQLAGRINRELSRETGLSEADYEILTALADRPGESVRILALRCGLDWEKSRLSHQLRRMEERGLVARAECVEDNRGAVVTVTESGRQRVQAARKCHDLLVKHYVTDVLTDDQLSALGSISEAILDNLDLQHQT